MYGHIVVGDHNTQRILSEMRKEFSVTVFWADGREEQMRFPNIARVAVDEVYTILIEHRGAGRTKMLVESICSEVCLEGPQNNSAADAIMSFYMPLVNALALAAQSAVFCTALCCMHRDE
jgi:hypothetical protein